MLSIYIISHIFRFMFIKIFKKIWKSRLSSKKCYLFPIFPFNSLEYLADGCRIILTINSYNKNCFNNTIVYKYKVRI